MTNICESIGTLQKKRHADSKDFCYDHWNLKDDILVD